MKPIYRIAFGAIVFALIGLAGCNQAWEQQPETAQPMQPRGAALRPSGMRELHRQLLKELADVTAKYDEEKRKRMAAQKEIDRYRAETGRVEAQKQYTAKELTAAQERLNALKAELRTVQTQKDQLAQQLQSKDQEIAAAKAEAEKARLHADKLATKLMAEETELVRLKAQFARMKIQQQIERAKGDLADQGK